ncbi:hypothetical protein GCM10027038_46610 [Arthrobacter bambusae]
MFVLFGGGVDLHVLQAVFGAAQERALVVAEGFFGGFRAVLVDRLDPAPGDPGQEIRIVLLRGAGQGVFRGCQIVCVGGL